MYVYYIYIYIFFLWKIKTCSIWTSEDRPRAKLRVTTNTFYFFINTFALSFEILSTLFKSLLPTILYYIYIYIYIDIDIYIYYYYRKEFLPMHLSADTCISPGIFPRHDARWYWLVSGLEPYRRLCRNWEAYIFQCPNRNKPPGCGQYSKMLDVFSWEIVQMLFFFVLTG